MEVSNSDWSPVLFFAFCRLLKPSNMVVRSKACGNVAMVGGARNSLWNPTLRGVS